jgi:neutral ceramidase
MRSILLALFAVASLYAVDAPKAPLMAGAATSNITPELGSEVVGGFLPFPCTHIHDELHARCLVLDDGQNKLALVVCDLLGMHRSLCVAARELVEKGRFAVLSG